MVVLSLALSASSAFAEQSDCADLRRMVNSDYVGKKVETSKAVTAYKKLYATALAPLAQVKSHLAQAHLNEIKNALSENRPVDGRFAMITGVVGKTFNRVGSCQKGYSARLGDEHDFEILNIPTYCVSKENEFDTYLPAQNNLYFVQGRIAMDTHSAIGKDQLVQEGCPGRNDCFIKVESSVIAKESQLTLRGVELTMDLSSPELNVRPSLESGLLNLDPAGVLSASREEYVETMLRDVLGRPDCATQLPAVETP